MNYRSAWLLRSILERAGHTVLDAPDGRTGLALWRREPTDVVVTDIFMPEMDGIEVILEMKNACGETQDHCHERRGTTRACSTGIRPPSRWGPTGYS